MDTQDDVAQDRQARRLLSSVWREGHRPSRHSPSIQRIGKPYRKMLLFTAAGPGLRALAFLMGFSSL
ncbi:hypothetical protein [Kibdelosporangium philippinense]|uniref:hypothetical protein n=1 Tax=Kibdelosporangium philippinense TaxID=211113 RepID=UPI00362211B0